MTSATPADHGRRFDQSATARLATLACESIGAAATDLHLLRLGENAIYEVKSSDLVIRIARTPDRWPDVQKEVRVAQWLAECNFPAIRLADFEQPFFVENHPVTIWLRADHGSKPVLPQHLGELLRQFHHLQMPTWLALPQFQPLGRVRQRLNNIPPEVSKRDAQYLRERLLELETDYQALEWTFTAGPVHGDAHVGNILHCNDGQILLLDFESTSLGQPEWDLSLTAGYRYGLGWYTDAQYRSFVDAYGYDISHWPGFETLRQVRELGMVSWLSQMVGQTEAATIEFRRRMDDLQRGTLPRRWKPL